MLTRLIILILQDTVTEASFHGTIARIETGIPFDEILKSDSVGTSDILARVDEVGKQR